MIDHTVLIDSAACEPPALQLGVLQPLISLVPTFADIARAAMVCTAWRDAARVEQEAWQAAVVRTAVAQRGVWRPSPVMDVNSTEFVERCLSIAARFGIELGRLGVSDCLLLALQALDLLDTISEDDHKDLRKASREPEMTLVCRPDETPSSTSSPCLLVARVERIPPIAAAVAEVLAAGLLLDAVACEPHSDDDETYEDDELTMDEASDDVDSADEPSIMLTARQTI